MTPAARESDGRLTKGQRTRERLLEEALRLFAQKGYEGVGTREVASAAETNIASIAFHFSGKEGLYEAVIERVAGELARLHQTALTAAARESEALGEDPGQRAGRMVAGLIIALLTSNRSQWMSLLLQREFITPTPCFAKIYDVALKPTLTAFGALLATAGGHDGVNQDNNVLAFALFIMASAFSRNKNTFLHFTEASHYTPADVETIGRVMAAFVASGLAPRP